MCIYYFNNQLHYQHNDYILGKIVPPNVATYNIAYSEQKNIQIIFHQLRISEEILIILFSDDQLPYGQFKILKSHHKKYINKSIFNKYLKLEYMC